MLKKLIKWLFSDWVVVFFISIGVILLLLTLAAFSGGLDPTRYGGINYAIGGTAFHRFLLKMTTPALIIKILLRESSNQREFKRGVSPLLRNYPPLPLDKGKGIKGIGFIIRLRRINNLIINAIDEYYLISPCLVQRPWLPPDTP